MSWLLDTNVVSELVRPQPDAGVLAWFMAREEEQQRLFLSALTLAEIHRGVLRLDPGHRRFAELRAWLDHDLPARFAGRILAFDEQVARTWGEMTAPLPKSIAIGNMDSLIAATARHHRLVLVTRNVTDMQHFQDLAVDSPWR